MKIELEASTEEVLMKLAMFLAVQVLVYLILSNSSDVFSKNRTRPRSFRTARSVSVRRMLAVFSDLPPGGELSPSST
ncbi:hypothetical protein MLD38_004232 [Melastoma candidum]|uniref:Uncharacterized protein n=1 Tax=Melastoma candidum TaxID=119954 RepID=A0ACB9SDM1_9MYRT|nr:hypothetical protein MLD38_004232 [Melastoma candidum]